MKTCGHAVMLGLALACGTLQGAVPERFEIASQPIETSHVPWAKPLRAGPVRVLCLVPIPSQRDVVELAQRLDVEYDLVAFQHPLMDEDAAEEFQKLLGDQSYDVILLSKVPVAKLPGKTRELLVDRVRRGAGVLSVNSQPTLSTADVIRPARAGSFLETSLPLGRLPEGCRPQVTVGDYGDGRAVSFSYPGRVTCLTPEVAFEEVNQRDWETYYQLLCRAVLWAAKREPAVQVELAWPNTAVDRRIGSPWHTEELVRTVRPRLVRATGRWEIEAAEERLPLPTWRGFGATVTEEEGQLKITEANVGASSGFAAGTFQIDVPRTPIVEVTVEQADAWSLFLSDPHFERALATLQSRTDQKGTRRYDLRESEGLGHGPVILCFSTFGEGASVVLSSLKFLTPDGEPPAEPPEPQQIPESAGVILRLRSASDASVTVTATYRGPDYYQPMDQREQQVALASGTPAEVTFPLLDFRVGKPCNVDLVVRDHEQRSLASAMVAYDVVSPVTLVSWAAEEELYRRGEKAVLVAKFENRSAPREVRLDVQLEDMHGRLIDEHGRKLVLPNGQSEHKLTLATDNSLTTLNRARLSVCDSKGPLVTEDAYVYLPEARPEWDDYLVSTSQFSNRSAYLRPYYTRIAREIGIEGMVIPLGYTLEILRQAAPVMYWGAADVRAFGYNFHATETSTARKPCLSDPETRAKISKAYEELGSVLRRYGPLAVASLEDESELSGARYSTLEVCTSEHCTGRYRDWLRMQYKTIESLNRAWDTSYASFDEITPITYPEARKLDNPAPWVDWRTFMEYVWLDALRLTRNGVEKHYPEIRMGFSNSFGQMPFSGWNYEALSAHVDMTIEYPTIIDRVTPPKEEEDPFEADALPMHIAIRQKLDIRRSFMRDEHPSPGWIWYDRSEQGAEFKPWWMAFLGAKGCTPWGPASLGVRQGAKRMDFWAFIHPLLAHTRSSKWLASGIDDLTRGVGKIFVDYEKAAAPVAVLYSQPSMHVAWVWSDVERAFYPETTSLYAWYYKSRVNVTRMLRELGFSYRYVGTSQIESGELEKYRVLFLPCSLCLSDETLQRIHEFVEDGGIVVADVGAGATDEHGKPIPQRERIERLFAVSRSAVCEKVEPHELRTTGSGDPAIPAGLKLAGADAIAARADARAVGPDDTPAIVVNPLGKGKAVYLNGFLGYNLPSRALMRSLLAQAGVQSPIRITSGGSERMGYECSTFRRGDLEILGILRLREEEQPTQVRLGQQKHLYDVRAKRYLGRTDTAEFDLTSKAAAVLAVMPYEIPGVKAQVSPERVEAGQVVTIGAEVLSSEGSPGDHVLRIEVYDPSGGLSRAYTDNVLAVAGRFEHRLQTALNDPPGEWRAVATDVISGKTAEAEFEIAGPR